MMQSDARFIYDLFHFSSTSALSFACSILRHGSDAKHRIRQTHEKHLSTNVRPLYEKTAGIQPYNDLDIARQNKAMNMPCTK